MAIEDNDERQRRCPRLGHEVMFRYCRTQEGETVCGHILDCWWEQFEVATFLENHLPPEDVHRLVLHRRPGKMTTLIELIERAKQREQSDEPTGTSENAR